MSKIKDQQEEGVLTRRDFDVKEPPMYRVILLNDDYTSMEFVVLILETVFRKNTDEATRIMLNVHHKGSASTGTYTKEVAETKIALVHQIARENDFPLKCRMEAV